MPRILALARPEFCLGLALAGAACRPCLRPEDLLPALGGTSGEAGIVIVEESLFAGLEPRLRKDLLRRAHPLLVPVPGELLWSGAGEAPVDDLLARLVRQAIGYRINIKL